MSALCLDTCPPGDTRMRDANEALTSSALLQTTGTEEMSKLCNKEVSIKDVCPVYVFVVQVHGSLIIELVLHSVPS